MIRRKRTTLEEIPMRRTGSIIGTLAVALVGTIGVVGGGYTIVTGNTVCSLVGACDVSA